MGEIKNISDPGFSQVNPDHRSSDFSKAMNLIPQNGSVQIELSLKLTAIDDNVTMRTETIECEIDWKEGKRYIFNFVFDSIRLYYTVQFSDYVDQACPGGDTAPDRCEEFGQLGE